MENKIIFKPIAATEKCFLDESIHDKALFERASMLRGERFSFQLACQCEGEPRAEREIGLRIGGDIAPWVKISRVDHVPVRFATYRDCTDTNYLRTAPGLYPDLLNPVTESSYLMLMDRMTDACLQSFWVDIRVPEDAPAGEHILTFALTYEETVLAETAFTAEVIPAVLPKQKLKFTQWFHCDCLADYYGVEMLSERHWEIIENFMRTAADNGINMLLTPVFTPPLDTKIGAQRPTCQLVGVKREKGEWSFDFALLDRWVKLCLDCGVEYFEISHLFTQWGAKHAPKVMATVDGVYQQVFGWDTDAGDDAYAGFLGQFIPALVERMTRLGVGDRMVFHVSDEPSREQLESYSKAKKIISDALSGQPIMDALSDFDFYQQGVVETPVVALDHIDPFLQAGVENLWGYYCCGQYREVSNRFLAMPTARNRIAGAQIYKYRLAGFLQWGYNFYYSCGSVERINPYVVNDGGNWVPAGDAFSVYPGPGGKALESIHMLGFTHALQDLRAMELAESLCGRETVLALLEEGLEPITFRQYPRSQDYILQTREKLNRLIAAHI